MDEQDRQQALENLLSSDENIRSDREEIKLSSLIIEAIDWLQTFLFSEPKPANDVYDAAAKIGYSRTTIKRAKSELKIYSRLEYNLAEHRNRWIWLCPERESGGV